MVRVRASTPGSPVRRQTALRGPAATPSGPAAAAVHPRRLRNLSVPTNRLFKSANSIPGGCRSFRWGLETPSVTVRCHWNRSRRMLDMENPLREGKPGDPRRRAFLEVRSAGDSHCERPHGGLSAPSVWDSPLQIASESIALWREAERCPGSGDREQRVPCVSIHGATVWASPRRIRAERTSRTVARGESPGFTSRSGLVAAHLFRY